MVAQSRALHRQILNSVFHIFRVINLDDQFQIGYTLPDRYSELMSIDNSGKLHTRYLPLARVPEEVYIASEDNAPQSRYPIK